MGGRTVGFQTGDRPELARISVSRLSLFPLRRVQWHRVCDRDSYKHIINIHKNVVSHMRTSHTHTHSGDELRGRVGLVGRKKRDGVRRIMRRYAVQFNVKYFEHVSQSSVRRGSPLSSRACVRMCGCVECLFGMRFSSTLYK